MNTIKKVLFVLGKIVSIIFFVMGVVFWINPQWVSMEVVKNIFGAMLIFLAFIPEHDVDILKIKEKVFDPEDNK